MKNKRIILACASVACMAFTLSGCGTRYIAADRLPQHAADFLSTVYPGQAVISAETDGWCDGYDVILKNGTQIEFSRKGNLENIEAGRGETLPAALSDILPAPLTSYLAANYPGQALTKVARDGKRWEIRVSGARHELVFDAQGNYLGADD